MDAIFKALADDTRRQILDCLQQRDGQTLGDIEQALADAGVEMTRFGVMKHLKVLEAASLVVSRRQGRFKFHYLNVVPLQQVIDRWIEPLTRKPMARAVLDLKSRLEESDVSVSEKPDFVLETYINTTPQDLWDALLDGVMTPKFYFGTRVETDGKKGGRLDYYKPDGGIMLGGEIIEADPPKRLEATFEPNWGEPAPPVSRYVYEIEPAGDACKLTILHFGVTPELEGVRDGWSRIAAGLKTLLETGEPLNL